MLLCSEHIDLHAAAEHNATVVEITGAQKVTNNGRTARIACSQQVVIQHFFMPFCIIRYRFT